MSTYQSFGSNYDDDISENLSEFSEREDIDLRQSQQLEGCVERAKSLGRRICLSRDFHQALILGQGLSLLICGTGIFSGLLQQQDFNFPVTQSFPLYLLLGITFTARLAYRSEERNILEILRKDGWKYALLGLVDVEANFLVVKAYGYTSVTSVQILDCFSIATVLFLSRVLLKTKYKPFHYAGVFVSVCGLAGLIAADIITGKNGNDGGSNVLLGDLLVIGGSLLYGVSNVAQEFVVKNFDKWEFLGMLGLFSSLISGVQIIILERDDLYKVDFTSYKIFLPWIGFIVVMYLIYTCMAYVIEKTSATVSNISVLSADFYSLIFGIIIFHYTFHILYFVSFVVVIIGVAIYSYGKTVTPSDTPVAIITNNHTKNEPLR